MKPNDQTDFAPPERQDQQQLREQYQLVLSQPLMQELLNSLPHVALVLNQERQIVFSNNMLLNMLGLSDERAYLGLRPGEIFNCIHARENPAGCGTSSCCRVCGAVQVVLESQKDNIKVSGESRITTEMNGHHVSFDLLVTSTPVIIDDIRFFIVNMTDISHEKRRRLLERVFFHDMMNSAGNIVSVSELALKKRGKRDEMIKMLLIASEQLIDDIQTQKKLLDAENNEAVINQEQMLSRECLSFSLQSYTETAEARNVHLHIDPRSDNVLMRNDRSILQRVLGNILKNAIEASSDGDVVTMGCNQVEDSVRFWINNFKHMDEEVRMQIFQRSFSTKGIGRGLGTYSIRLFTEKYLDGTVDFTTSETGGTTFTVTVPLKHHISEE